MSFITVLRIWSLPGRNAPWLISLRYKSRQDRATIAKWRCTANPAENVRYCPVGWICNLTSGSYIKQKSERDGLKVNKQKTLFYVSSVQGNTVPSYVHLSINNVFVVKTKDTLKKCVERKLLKKMFQHIKRILLHQCTN